MTIDIYQVLKKLVNTKGTAAQMYAGFEDIVDIEKQFPSIINTPNEHIFGKEDTIMEDTKYLIHFFNLPSLFQLT